ncbi:MAG: hypothetical protein ABSH03_20290 [Candidatus Lustribacter sp.]|jgi:hypothetical protein
MKALPLRPGVHSVKPYLIVADPDELARRHEAEAQRRKAGRA